MANLGYDKHTGRTTIAVGAPGALDTAGVLYFLSVDKKGGVRKVASLCLCACAYVCLSLLGGGCRSVCVCRACLLAPIKHTRTHKLLPSYPFYFILFTHTSIQTQIESYTYLTHEDNDLRNKKGKKGSDLSRFWGPNTALGWAIENVGDLDGKRAVCVDVYMNWKRGVGGVWQMWGMAEGEGCEVNLFVCMCLC